MTEIKSSSNSMHKHAGSVSTESPSYFYYLGEHKTDWPASPRVKTSRSRGKHLSKIGRGSPRVTLEIVYLSALQNYI